MTRLFMTLCLMMPLLAIGQVSFWTEGARWSYYQDEIAPANDEVQIRFQVDGDTLIQGVEAHILRKEFRRINFQGDLIGPSLSTDYVAQSGDSILYFENGNWELVMNFDVSQGDTVVLYFGRWNEFDCAASDTMLIDSVYTTDYEGLSLKTVDYRDLIQDQLDEWFNPEWIPPGTYMERVGFVFDHPVVQPIGCQIAVLEHVAISLECYTDNEIENNGGGACNLVLSDEAELLQEKPKLTCAQGQLQIQNAPNSTLRIYDILGKELFQMLVQSDNETVDINQLQNGILMVVLESGESRIAQKVVKFSN